MLSGMASRFRLSGRATVQIVLNYDIGDKSRGKCWGILL
jgi:hypothetical protein